LTTAAAPIATPTAVTTPTAPAAAAAPAQTAAEHVFEVKVGGEVKKYGRSEAEKLLSKAGYADKLTQQAKEQLKAIAEERERIKAQEALWDDDEALEKELEKRGKLDKLARKRLQAKVAEAEMTPEQRAIAERDAKIAELERSTKEREAKEQEAKRAQLRDVMRQQMENQLAAAAEKAGFPKGADSFFAIYEAVKEFHRLGLPFDPERIVETARENIEDGFKRLESSVLKDLKGEALAKRLGDNVVKEILRYSAEKLRNGGARPNPPPAFRQQQRKPEAPAYISPHELQEKYRAGQR
jgi:hypothetical protein